MKYLAHTQTYISIRYASLAISFLLSLFYSKELGLLNRAIAGFVFLVSGLLIILLTQGLGLKVLYLHNSQMLSEGLAFAYLKAALSLLAIGLAALNFSLLLFLHSLDHIEINIFFVVSFYFVIAFSGQLYFDFLLRTSSYSHLNLLLITQSFASPLFFYVFLFYFRLSVFSSVYTSLGTAVALSAFVSVQSNHGLRRFLKNASRTEPFKFSRSNYTFKTFFTKPMFKSVFIPILERLDRVLVLGFFPLEVFSQVVLAQSFLFILKPIQEVWVNGLVIPFQKSGSKLKAISTCTNILLVFSAFLSLPLLYFVLVNALLGNAWLLSLNVFIFLLLFEIVKLYFLGRVTNSFMKDTKF